MTPDLESELRKLARETYNKTCIGRSHMPSADTDEGQRKIDRLFDIMSKQFRSPLPDKGASAFTPAGSNRP